MDDDEEDTISLGGTPEPKSKPIPASSANVETQEAASTSISETDKPANVELEDEAAPALTVERLTGILEKRSAGATLLAESYKDSGFTFNEICPYSTRSKCTTGQPDYTCPMIHFQIRQFPQAEPSLGDCSYLNTCHHHDTCRYLHYELETPTREKAEEMAKQRRQRESRRAPISKEDRLLPPQWIDADLRKLDATVLGKFDVVMLDPPWDSKQTHKP